MIKRLPEVRRRNDPAQKTFPIKQKLAPFAIEVSVQPTVGSAIEGKKKKNKSSFRELSEERSSRVCSLSRTRFLHRYLVWIAGERAPFIITICCRVRVSCYVANTHACMHAPEHKANISPLLSHGFRSCFSLFLIPRSSSCFSPTYARRRPYEMTHIFPWNVTEK